MEKALNLVILGGAAAGPTAASQARRISKEARIVILENMSLPPRRKSWAMT